MTRKLPSRRTILVAVDASPQSLAALEIAAKVASRLNAELRGMYVEDIDLLRIAALPFACAIASSGHTQPLTPQVMERELHRHAEIARSAVEAAGVRSHIVSSFSVARGSVYREIERAATAAEFVTVGRSGWSAPSTGRLGSVARSLIEAGNASLLMVGEGGVRGPVAVVFDGSPASERALSLASALDLNNSQAINVLVIGDENAERLQRSRKRIRYEVVSGHDSIFDGIQRSGARTVLMPSSIFRGAVEKAVLLERKNLSVFLIQ